MSSQKRFKFTKNFQNGDRYDGEAIGENVKDGVGEYFWAATNATYKGQWVNDVPHGKGVMQMPGTDGYEYDGEFVNGRRHGKGSCKFQNGQEYVGEWQGDRMHGTGVLKGSPSDDFVEYSGHFENGLRDGSHGVCQYRNGSSYSGCWRQGRRQGLGELQLSPQYKGSGNCSLVTSQPVKYRGPFHMDEASNIEMREPAEILYADGSTYKGDVDRLEFEGNGELELKGGDVFKGSFAGGRRQGKGVMKYADGKTYEGNWRDDRMEGVVTFRNSEKALRRSSGPPETTIASYVGPCVMDDFTGSNAKVTYHDGSVYSGDVRQGLANGKGVMENRSVTNWPSAVFGPEVLIKRYEGEFFGGKPEGSGEGQIQIGSTFSPEAGEARLPPSTKGLLLSYRRNGGFNGKWAQGLPQGTGVWRWDGGDYYSGPVSDGIPDGVGEYKSAQEHYQGEFQRGVPSGHGQYEHLLLKESYSGEWSEGLFHGKGVYNKEATRGGDEAVTYSGDWVRGKRNGKGSETIGNIHYEGDFVDGRWDGKGVWRNSDNNFVYEGTFRKGELTGTGEMTLPKGTVITGEFENGVPDGHATVKFTNQGIEEYKGLFEKGEVCGEGEIRYANGDYYKGEVEPSYDDNEEMPGLTPQRHGKGSFTFVEGNRLECTWNHNVLHGQGKYFAVGADEPQLRQYVDGVISTQKVNDNIFTPENMFPNTQSEDALKEKMQSQNKPFKYIKKGDPKTAPSARKKSVDSPSQKKQSVKGAVKVKTNRKVSNASSNNSAPSPRKSSLPQKPPGKRPSEPNGRSPKAKRASLTPQGRVANSDSSPPLAMRKSEEAPSPTRQTAAPATSLLDRLPRD
ncbi:MORNvariant family protein [Angomonas deanei]|uniref:MORN repeat, putative n=1 Tax=Angomonas deanei TaxID=59799 RepID=A0A7G2CF76_9TRYP|nr:MORNvariant family protein [Angomonas deanei]CAD2218558.1 MORN repeat, putative [Angomonas deanei]|eukprot:EPY24507.1 MORNvariant family protein [Angomonas deanei]